MWERISFSCLALSAAAALALLSDGCTSEPDSGAGAGEPAVRDSHSYANADQVAVSHIDLDLTVDFERQVLRGSATLSFEQRVGRHPMILDTRALDVQRVEVSDDGQTFQPAEFTVGAEDPVLGAPLEVALPVTHGAVRVHYATTPGATALQWLAPAQTSGRRHPFLFTQSQAIHARSWIPLQDSPAVKTTYGARIRTPEGVRAVMSAGNEPRDVRDGDYTFQMPQPVPSYLIALAVGDLEFRSLGKRTGVYAEPEVVEKAAAEFEDTEQMLEIAERLFGRYEWGRYDLLVLPPSFPFGGMENPRLTFATPTILAGDKSLVALVAHELAHSWSGNLVTNATWSDFWLNEGFTVYLERRIIEAVYGPERAAMEAALGRQSLAAELERLEPRDQILHVALEGRDPDEGFTEVPYEKGFLLLRSLEQACGRDSLDAFLRGYFERHAFKSITTADFREDLQFHLFNTGPADVSIPLDEWIEEPGIPAGAWEPSGRVFERVEEQAQAWLRGEKPAAAMRAGDWNTHEWRHLLNLLPPDVGAEKLAELDRAYRLTQTGNAEILCEWLRIAIANGYEPARPRLREFLTSQGRRKFLKPLYEEMAKTPEGKRQALAIYQQARPMYHPISTATIDQILGYGG